MDDTPLIWTSKGNLPIEALTYEHKWEDSEEYMKFSETYSLDGEVVKQSAHVYKKKGLDVFGEQFKAA